MLSRHPLREALRDGNVRAFLDVIRALKQATHTHLADGGGINCSAAAAPALRVGLVLARRSRGALSTPAA